ncbi:DUF386 domain-containing protein [Atopobacter sp. AH10]|uniref:YhcH/YjgK/YiaL family protein n=1 Tax=Atopobacter sp. AH10 TaxID=2315861 RepID=UPI000EF1E81A|nr:YhcH/YjgK/YiaL family protein [Atopobacter sp. AH10]RLK62834.1 DUF386 domain-containing protein [Atopobacter sp. AH10]
MELYRLNHLESLHREDVKRVVDYIRKHDLSQDQPGPHEIEDGFYYNVLSYDSTDPENRMWESHKEYLDVHVPISGREGIHHSFIEDMELKEYIAADDWQKGEGEAQNRLAIEPGQILVFDREDMHKTGIKLDRSYPIKKAVFKVKYE